MISEKPEQTLPHREPFLWVTRLIERDLEGNRGIVEYDVKSELDLFRGHFPGQPVFPGVIQIEAAAQACLWIRLGELPPGSALPQVLFVGVESYRFRKPVIPPETLIIEAQWQKTRAGIQVWDVECTNSKKERVSSGSFLLKMDLQSSGSEGT